MQLYQFSPIESKEKLLEAGEYVVRTTSELMEKVVGATFPISSLTVFSHYEEEFENLKIILESLGDITGDTNGPRVKLHEPRSIGQHTITYLRVRKPDIYRSQVGCVDFDVSDYHQFKSSHLADFPQNLRLIERPDYELIELFDPNHDVLGYILSEPVRSTF